eukprot:scaffold73225_cov63-Phaeocystis_antarctica.AAC.4
MAEHDALHQAPERSLECLGVAAARHPLPKPSHPLHVLGCTRDALHFVGLKRPRGVLHAETRRPPAAERMHRHADLHRRHRTPAAAAAHRIVGAPLSGPCARAWQFEAECHAITQYEHSSSTAPPMLLRSAGLAPARFRRRSTPDEPCLLSAPSGVGSFPVMNLTPPGDDACWLVPRPACWCRHVSPQALEQEELLPPREILVHAPLRAVVTGDEEREARDQGREAARQPSDDACGVCDQGAQNERVRRELGARVGAERRGAHPASAEHCCVCRKRREPTQLSMTATKTECTLCTRV